LTIDSVADPGDGNAVRGPKRNWRLMLSFTGPLVIVGALAYLLAIHGHEVEQAAKRVSAADLLLVTLLALLTLLARTEAVIACLTAMSNRTRRVDIHAANSLTFLAATINHYASSIVRGALVKRLDREHAPTIPQMIMIDTATTLIEALVVAILIVVSAGALKVAWWVPVLLVLAGVAAIAAALLLRRRFARHNVLRGLDVLAHSRQRIVVALLMIIVICTQVARTLIVLQAVGLHPSLLQAVATFVAAGVLSSLFAGPAAGTAGGPLLIFGHSSLAASAAAGLVLSITSLLAGVLYAIPGGPLFIWRLRRRSS
jgi:hypothetical protein